MNHRRRAAIVGAALCVAASLLADVAQATVVGPTWNPPERQAVSETASDPVLPVIASLGQSSDAPRLDPTTVPRRSSSADGMTEILFAGGVASATGVARLLEGVGEARDPAQLLPHEPTVAVRISAPGAELLLLAAAALIALRHRARTGGPSRASETDGASIRRRPRRASRAAARWRRR